MDLTQKRILVTGGSGFIGQHVRAVLRERGCTNVYSPRHAQFNLLNRDHVHSLFNLFKPEVVINLAASLGGIAVHVENSSQIFYENMRMGLEITEEALKFGVEKFVHIGTSCSYPANAVSPMKEECLWQGFPNSATAPYGVAKLALMLQAQVYRKERNFPAITVIPANVYGVLDVFDPKRTHVIPALILKALEAVKRDEPLTVWGTGKATREFIYATDCAEGIVRATESYDSPEPVNLGTGIETSIREVATLVAKEIGVTKGLVWDSSKPDGALGRVFDVSRAESFGFKAKTSLEAGVRRTIDWYLSGNPQK
jgi:GDP-L-fucose synthase